MESGFTTVIPQDEVSATTSLYYGNTTKTIDPTGKWKKYVTNAAGNLTQVSMPRGAITQTRTFVYDAATQQLSSATNPESPSASTAALRRRSNPVPITVPNYNRKTDRLQFGTLIAIPRNPQPLLPPSTPCPLSNKSVPAPPNA